ncbi:MAG: ABC transporter ATP-binding protein, partial [Actinomycetes bacterium]
HMLLGLLPPSGGAALIGGVDVQRSPLEAYRRVGFVSENVLLYGNLSARKNMRFFASVCGHAVPESRIDALLRRVALSHAQDRPVRTFSKGMRQRLGLAVALVKDPDALVLDEPTTGLDPDGADALLDVIRSLREEKRAVLMSTHDLDRVPEVADRIAVMGGGRIRAIVPGGAVPGGGMREFYRRHTEAEPA